MSILQNILELNKAQDDAVRAWFQGEKKKRDAGRVLNHFKIQGTGLVLLTLH